LQIIGWNSDWTKVVGNSALQNLGLSRVENGLLECRYFLVFQWNVDIRWITKIDILQTLRLFNALQQLNDLISRELSVARGYFIAK